jgi:hypothetical protein
VMDAVQVEEMHGDHGGKPDGHVVKHCMLSGTCP